MEIQETMVKDVAVVHMTGRLWGEPEGDNLGETLNRLRSQGCLKVVIDMSEVSMMNSSGLGSLIAGLKSFRDAGGDMKLSCVNERILTILRITKLIQVFKIHDTQENAVQSFAT